MNTTDNLKVRDALKILKPFATHFSEEQLRQYLYSGMRKGVIKFVKTKNPITKSESKLILKDEVERLKKELQMNKKAKQ